MLKVTVDETNAKVKMSGTMLDLMTSSLIAVKSIYNVLRNNDKKAAEVFKMAVDNGYAWATVDELKEAVKKEEMAESKESASDVFERIDSLMEELDDLLDGFKRKE